MKSIAFFNNKSGVGKTSLVYQLSWMFADRGVPVLAVDLDPQANLTAMFLEEERLVSMWDDGEKATVSDSLQPLMNRTGDIASPHVEKLTHTLGLIPGNLALSRFEDLLSENWPKCLDEQESAFRVITAFFRIIEAAVTTFPVELVLIDVGPNLGSINRSALISADQVVVPLGPDLFSLQGLKNLGPTLREWRKGWGKRLEVLPQGTDISAPEGKMQPTGYVVMQHSIRESRPVKAYQRWMERMPGIYREYVLSEQPEKAPLVAKDPYHIALIKHYRSLMPMAMDARKPMFFLKPSDGAIGSHVEAVMSCYNDFFQLAKKIAENAEIAIS